MTVKELIEQLQALDPDQIVTYAESYVYGIDFDTVKFTDEIDDLDAPFYTDADGRSAIQVAPGHGVNLFVGDRILIVRIGPERYQEVYPPSDWPPDVTTMTKPGK